MNRVRKALGFGATLVALLATPASAQYGWAVGGTGDIFKSTDAGTSWTGNFPTTALVNSVHFRDTTTGWVAGTQVILKTTNGGTNWTDKYTGGGVLHGIYFVSATNGWAVGASGVIAKSTNAGETWTESFPTTAILNGVFAIDTNTAWIAGNQVIFKTTNGGTNWTDKYNGGAALNSVHFPSSTIGWAVGNTGTIAKSTNAGETWTETFPTTATLNGVFFTSTTTGFACGSQVIFKTTNGGTNWTDKYTGGADLQSVHFLNANEGWAVGSNGTIVKSTNAGETWVEQVHPTTTTLESVVFVTPPMVSVTVQTSPTGRSFSVDGTSYTTAQTFSWVSGSSHTIATTSPQAGATGTQYVWSNWSDGGAISHTVAPTVATTYTANFTTQYFLTMTAGSGGTVSPASGYRNAGSSVSISATPNSGFTFTGWTGTGSGSYTGTNNPANVTMNAPITESAAFAANISVTVQTSPTGRSFSVDGTTYTSAQTFSWVPGSSHTIATTSPQAGATGIQYVWSNWSDGGAISHSVAPTVGTTFTANFTTQYFLTMTAGSGGTVSPASGWRNSGSSVSISATPNSGFSFAGWTGTGSGSYTGSNNPANVTMNGPISETAAFSAATVAVTVQATLSASFRVDGVGYDTPQAFVWATGSVHTVGADSIQVAPGGDERLVWQSWSDAGALEHSVTASSDATITATFAREYALTMAVEGMGMVTPGSGWVTELADVTIEAVADSGWTFVNWIGTGPGSYTGIANPVVINAAGPVFQTAVFQSAATDIVESSGRPLPAHLEASIRSARRAGDFDLELGLPHAATVKLEMFTVTGRRVLEESLLIPSAGWHTRRIGSGDARIESLPSGVCFVRVSARGESVTRKLVVIR